VYLTKKSFKVTDADLPDDEVDPDAEEEEDDDDEDDEDGGGGADDDFGKGEEIVEKRPLRRNQTMQQYREKLFGKKKVRKELTYGIILY
jgi:hypothetical protein